MREIVLAPPEKAEEAANEELEDKRRVAACMTV